MKYILAFVSIIFTAACNNTGKSHNDRPVKVIPFYRASNWAYLGYKGEVKQVDDTIFDMIEKKDEQWVIRSREAYKVFVTMFDSQGRRYASEEYFVSEGPLDDEKLRYIHRSTIAYQQVEDSTKAYGITYNFETGKGDTVIESITKPLDDLSFSFTLYDIDSKTKQRKLSEKQISYLNNEYRTLKKIFSYPGSETNDTVTYHIVSDKMNEADTNNMQVILAKDSTGNPTIILDRSNPKRKQLHRIGYSYYK